jgi:hypothetical protein
LLKKQKKPAFRQVCAWFEPKLWSETDSKEVSPRHAAADGTATRRDDEEQGDHRTAPSEASSSTTTPTSQLNLRVEQLEAETARAILRDCSALVGLHSDQATEPVQST